MQNSIPVPGSTKARLALAALEQFGAWGYDDVGVARLCTKAGVTTGALYHHFGGKPGLYAFVRGEAERRIVDRMEGAAAALADDDATAALRAALLVGFDAAVAHGVARLLSEPAHDEDRVVELLARLAPAQDAVLARILGAAWRAALHEAAPRGAAAQPADVADRARAALGGLAMLPR